VVQVQALALVLQVEELILLLAQEEVPTIPLVVLTLLVEVFLI